MLAIYDSEGNQLKKDASIPRTVLYDSLLRRFVERELRKDHSFRDLPHHQRMVEVDLGIERLGVTALGMFNRRSLEISGAQLFLIKKVESKVRALDRAKVARVEYEENDGVSASSWCCGDHEGAV